MKYMPQTKRFLFGLFLIIALALMPGLMRAQNLSIAPVTADNAGPFIPKWKLFMGANISGVYSNVQFRVILSTGFTNPVQVDAINLPAGVSASFTANLFTNTTTLTLVVAVTNVAKGLYPLTVQASNTVTSATYSSNLLTMVFGTLWTNADPTAVSWNNAANWSAGIPANGDDVMFQDGTDTNYLDYSVALNSLTYLRNSNGFIQNTVIAPGTTLSVTGTNGFGASVQSVNGNSKTTTIYIQGPGAGLVVSNQNADFAINAVNTGGSGTTVIMTNLDNFTANVKRFGAGDVVLAEQGGLSANFVNVSLAKTNVISSLFSSDYTVTNALQFAVSLFRNADDYNNGSAQIFNLGLSNSIVADSMAISQARASGTLRFAPVFTNIAVFPKPYLYVRGTNGGRMTLFGAGVDSGVSAAGSSLNGVVFLNNGTVDMLVDQMWLGRTRNTNTPAGAGQGTFQMSDGLVNANRVILGYQPYINDSFARGTLTVAGTGVFVVNNTLDMGWDAGFVTPTGTGSGHGATQGTITMTGGQIRANTITVGGVTNDNGVCAITLNSGELVVSNTIASPARALNTLNISGGRLTLFIDGTKTNPYVYVTTLNVPANVGSELKIASVQNLTFPTNVPLISFVSQTAFSFSNIVMPSGLHGTTILNGSQYDLQILANVPKNLVWRGYSDNTWTVSPAVKNWLDVNTGLHTNFDNGDSVTFDDAAGIPTDISIVDANMTLSSALFTNNSNHYILDNGGGSFVGSAIVTKTGINALDINATTAFGVQVNQGSLLGNSSGQIGSASIAAGATMDFSGKILNSVNCSGTASLEPTATLAGTLAVTTGGIVTNFGTVSGSFSVGNNGVLVNGLNGNFTTFGSSTVGGTNAFLLNRGFLGVDLTHCGVNLTINSGCTFEDTGEGWVEMTGTLTISSGATFIPGGDGVGTSSIFKGTGTGFPARVFLAQGSTNIFKVNNDNGTYTQLGSGYQDFGGSASTRTFNGATIKIVNVGSAPITAGQSFPFFFNSDLGAGTPIAFTGTATNTWPVIDPLVPALGLGWDISAVTVKGVIKVVTVATNIPTIGFLPNVTTLITTNSTNSLILNGLTWPSDHTGWTLQQLQPPLSVGVLATNWQDVFGSMWTNSMVITNSVSSNTATFFRLKYP